MIDTPNFKHLLKEQYPSEMAQIEEPQQYNPQDQEYSVEEQERQYNMQEQYPTKPQQMIKQHQEGYDQNPFEIDQYSGNVPDQPLSYGGSMADGMLSDNEVPENIRKKFWFIFHKDNTLTFLDQERKMSKLLNFDITKIDILNTMPYYDYTFDKEFTFDVLRNVFETKLDRALGFGKGAGLKNERIMLQSQFTENRQINENSEGNSMIRQGFFKRLLSRR